VTAVFFEQSAKVYEYAYPDQVPPASPVAVPPDEQNPLVQFELSFPPSYGHVPVAVLALPPVPSSEPPLFFEPPELSSDPPFLFEPPPPLLDEPALFDVPAFEAPPFSSPAEPPLSLPPSSPPFSCPPELLVHPPLLFVFCTLDPALCWPALPALLPPFLELRTGLTGSSEPHANSPTINRPEARNPKNPTVRPVLIFGCLSP